MMSPRLRVFLGVAAADVRRCGGGGQQPVLDRHFVFSAHATRRLSKRCWSSQLKDGSVSRLLMLAVEGGDETQRASVSRAMRERLLARRAVCVGAERRSWRHGG